MTGYDCPVEGCDYTSEQIGQLRGHVNASTEHPSWEAVKGDLDAGSELVDQNDQPETTPSEGGESPDENGDGDQPDDPPERGDEGADEGEDGPADAGSEDDDQSDSPEKDMPTDDELQRQRVVQGSQPAESGSDEETSQETQSTSKSTSSKGGESAGLLPAIGTSTIIMLVAALAVALILYRLLSGDGDDRESDDIEDEDDEETSSEDVDDLPNFDATDLEDL